MAATRDSAAGRRSRFKIQGSKFNIQNSRFKMAAGGGQRAEDRRQMAERRKAKDGASEPRKTKYTAELMWNLGVEGKKVSYRVWNGIQIPGYGYRFFGACGGGIDILLGTFRQFRLFNNPPYLLG